MTSLWAPYGRLQRPRSMLESSKGQSSLTSFADEGDSPGAGDELLMNLPTRIIADIEPATFGELRSYQLVLGLRDTPTLTLTPSSPATLSVRAKRFQRGLYPEYRHGHSPAKDYTSLWTLRVRNATPCRLVAYRLNTWNCSSGGLGRSPKHRGKEEGLRAREV